MWALKVGTPDGLGLTNDSAAYIAGARSILQGTGYSDIWLDHPPEPITHYPPLFSFFLALIGLSGLDPLRGARLLNVLLYGANTFGMGLIGWKVSRARVGGVALALLFALQPTFLRVHSFALSEPLFLFFSLIAFLSLARHVETGRFSWLALTGIAIGLATLTRYTGLSLLATFVLAMLILLPTWRERLKNAAALLMFSIPWPLAWMLRDYLLTGSATNRGMAWHPPTAERIRQGLNRFAYFLLPVETWWSALRKVPGLFAILAALVGLVVLLWVLFVGARRFLRPAAAPRPDVLTFASGLYVVGYFAALVTSMTLFDPATRFQDRILAPALVSLLVAAFAGLWRLLRARRRWVQGVAVLVILSVAVLWAFGQAETMADLQKGGQVYAGWKWRQSPAMGVIRRLPPEIRIYTNSPPAVYLVTGRPSRYVRLPMGEGENARKSREVVRAEVQAGRAVLVFFDTDRMSQSELDDLQRLTSGLHLAYKFGDDLIFGQP